MSKYNYQKFSNYWLNTKKEDFFMSYALWGPMANTNIGTRYGLPVTHPIKGPVNEPSPLNNRYKYDPYYNTKYNPYQAIL